MCVSTVYSPESCEQISQACYSVGIRTHDPCNSRAVCHQLDYRGSLVARSSSNPMFWQRVPQRYKILISYVSYKQAPTVAIASFVYLKCSSRNLQGKWCIQACICTFRFSCLDHLGQDEGRHKGVICSSQTDSEAWSPVRPVNWGIAKPSWITS